MSARKHSAWLRCYPRAWRERYGDELTELIDATSDGGRVAWRVRHDLLRAGARERLRDWGWGRDAPPRARAKAGALLVLGAWAMFVVAGIAVQRFSEHWQQLTPNADRGLPSGAFDALLVAALVAATLVLGGIVCVLPRLLAFVRAGGWREMRRGLLAAVGATALACAAGAALVVWAHHLDAFQRNGHDALYGLAFVAAGLLLVGCLAAWTAVAVSTARRLELPARLLEAEVALAAAVSVAMLAMTIATAVWWGALASDAPWALHGQPAGAGASPLLAQLLAAMLLMALATGLGALGAGHSLRALVGMRSQRRAR